MNNDLIIGSVELLGYGVIKKSESECFDEKNASSPTGYFKRVDDIEVVEETNEIEARPGVVFGIKYKLASLVEGEIISFQCKIIHPELENPDTGIVFSETVEDKCDYTNEVNFDFYEFENEWELVDGIWCFQITEGDVVVFEHAFNVQKIV